MTRLAPLVESLLRSLGPQLRYHARAIKQEQANVYDQMFLSFGDGAAHSKTQRLSQSVNASITVHGETVRRIKGESSPPPRLQTARAKASENSQVWNFSLRGHIQLGIP